jgi:hypothetical protein
MSDNQQTVRASGGIGMGGALFLLFLGLKLTGHIDWSWWWITAPLWIPLGIIVAIFMVFGAVLLVMFMRQRKLTNRLSMRR